MNDIQLSRSGSSHLFEYVTAFRNVDGFEENWKSEDQSKPISYLSYFKVTLAEPLYLGIAVTALCEMVAYGILFSLTWPLKIFSDVPFNFNVMLFKSSTRICYLSVSCMFLAFKFLTRPNIHTHEGYSGIGDAYLTLPPHLQQKGFEETTKYKLLKRRYEEAKEELAKINQEREESIDVSKAENEKINQELRLILEKSRKEET